MIFFYRVSQFVKEETVGEQSASDTVAYADSDDVLYRFCGAALASTLHSRHKLIQTCPLERKDAVSQEILLLKSINSKGESYSKLSAVSWQGIYVLSE